jgi:hypothetical protein
LDRAGKELRAVRDDFPEQPGIDLLDERLRQARVQAQLAALEQEVNQSLSRGDLEKAWQQLTAAQGWANNPRWQALQQQLLRRQGY